MIDKEYYSLYWQTKMDGEGCGGLGEKPHRAELILCCGMAPYPIP
jgi:hypothetical protein